MERDIWTLIRAALRRLPRTRRRNEVYSDAQVLAILLWAALHDRPVSWACQRRNWPMQAWRRKLPDQTTMSRRMRKPATLLALRQLAYLLQEDRSPGQVVVIDGKPLEVSEHTSDPDARQGRGAGRFARGYKLHVIADPVTPQRRASTTHHRRPRAAAGSRTDARMTIDHDEQVERDDLAPARRLHIIAEILGDGVWHGRGDRQGFGDLR